MWWKGKVVSSTLLCIYSMSEEKIKSSTWHMGGSDLFLSLSLHPFKSLQTVKAVHRETEEGSEGWVESGMLEKARDGRSPELVLCLAHRAPCVPPRSWSIKPPQFYYAALTPKTFEIQEFGMLFFPRFYPSPCSWRPRPLDWGFPTWKMLAMQAWWIRGKDIDWRDDLSSGWASVWGTSIAKIRAFVGCSYFW